MDVDLRHAEKAAIRAHDSEIVTQCEHRTGGKSVAVAGGDRDVRGGDHPGEEALDVGDEGGHVYPWAQQPFEVEPIGEELPFPLRHQGAGIGVRINGVEGSSHGVEPRLIHSVLALVHGQYIDVVPAIKINQFATSSAPR